MEVEVNVSEKIKDEFDKIRNSPIERLSVKPDSKNLSTWQITLDGTIFGSSSSNYISELNQATIHFSLVNYFNDPPFVVFMKSNPSYESSQPYNIVSEQEWRTSNYSVRMVLQKLLDILSRDTISSNSDDHEWQKKSFLEQQIQQEFLEKVIPRRFKIPKISIIQFTQDKKEGALCVKIRVDLSNWTYIQEKYGQPDVVQTCITFLDGLTSFGYERLGYRFLMSHIDLSDTDVSMRVIFNGKCATRPIHREVEVEVLNLTHTKTSTQALGALCRLTKLRELYLDHCDSIIKEGRFAFSALSKEDRLPKLQILSVVATSSMLSHTWLSEVQAVCPELNKIYFTRKKGTKAIGWQDVILMQTVRNPVLLPCGHIGDRNSLKQLGYCSFDRQHFKVNDLTDINPSISLLSKENDKWIATIVDFHRKPLENKVLFHVSCGCFFNLKTARELWDVVGDSFNEEAIKKVKTQICPDCQTPLAQNLRVCFPSSAEQSPEDQTFENLERVSAYSMVLSGIRNT